MTERGDARTENLALWEGLATLHGGGLPGYYDLDALAEGHNPIHTEVEETLHDALGGRGVADLDVLHVQSHIAIDSIEMARRGARVTCADFSPTALARAADIARRCDVHLDLVEADSTALPSTLHRRFDLAYATIGAICWIEDIDAWMRSVAACLRPGGTLLLTDIHPLYSMVDTEQDPVVFDLSYTFRAGGLAFDQDGSYADRNAKLPATRGVVFAHSIGEIVTAAVDAGLRIDKVREFTEATFQPTGIGLALEDDGLYRWRLAPTAEPLPTLFSLIARNG